MKEQIISKVIGMLIQDETFDDWWKSKEVSIPLFDFKKLPVTFMDFDPSYDTTFLDQADKAIQDFLNLTATDRLVTSDLVYQNFVDTLESLGDEYFNPELVELKEPKEVWRFVTPSEVFISRRDRRDKDIYISISCGCGWEEEHGLQLIYRQGKKLTRVSGHDGHLTQADAYDIPDDQDELLSRF